MIFFKRNKTTPSTIVPKKELDINLVGNERVLTAEGWRRRAEAKSTQLAMTPSKKAKKAK